MKGRAYLQAFNVAMEQLYKGCGHDHAVQMKLSNALQGVSDKLIDDIYVGRITEEQIPDRLYMETARILSNDFEKNFVPSTGYTDPKNALIASIKTNLFAFSAAKSAAQGIEIRNQLIDKDGKLKSKTDFRRDAKKIIGKYNDRWLDVERQDVIAKSQTMVQWEQIKEDKELYPYLRYRTVGDERVSDEHAALNGITRRVDDDFWDTYMPPNRYGCRCDVEQLDEEEAEETPVATTVHKKAKVPKEFRNNPGKSRQMQTQDHPYFKDSSIESMNDWKAEKTYGMKPLENIYKKKDSLPKIAEKDFNEFWDGMVKKNADESGNGFVLKSILGRDVLFPPKLKQHLIKRKDIASNMKEVLENPDEVFTQVRNNKIQTSYIKYFQDSPYVLVEKENAKGILEVTTFYPLDKSGSVGRKRIGILMYRK